MKHLFWIFYNILFYYVLLIIVELGSATIGDKCDIHSLSSCGENEACNQTVAKSKIGICSCVTPFKDIGGVCKFESSTSTTNVPTIITHTPITAESDSHVLAALIWVSCLTIICGLLFFVAARRYKWMDQLHKLTIRNYNTVLVSSLNDDDAPIS